MNVTMQQPASYPFYMGRPPVPLVAGLPSTPAYLSSPIQQQFPSFYPNTRALSPLVLSQQQNPFAKIKPLSSSYSNMRYNQLKQSTAGYPTRRSMRRKQDSSKRLSRSHTYNAPVYDPYYGSSVTKSVSHIEPLSRYSSTHLPKSQSWHMVTNQRQSNLSVAYANEIHLTPRRRRKHSPKKRRRQHLSQSPKRHPSLVRRRKRPVEIPQCGVVRISTLDEMPIATKQTSKRSNSTNNDRSSMKGSISNSSKRRPVSKDRSNEKSSIKNRKITDNNESRTSLTNHSSSSPSSSSSSSSLPSLSSSDRSQSSFQQRINGSLRNDPLINAAMEDFQRLRRGSSQSRSVTPRIRSPSPDSLSSNSTIRAMSLARSHSQSSFTSLERSEIRELIKTVKTKSTQALDVPIPSNTISVVVSSSEPSTLTLPSSPVVIKKTKKSSLTEELDREFDKLRARDPDQELTNVIPSSMCKRKKTLEKPSEIVPPPPKFDELLRQVQLRHVNNSTKPVSKVKHTPIDSNYENPLSSVPVPRSSPIPSAPEKKIKDDTKHEYAMPIKRTAPIKLPFAHVSHFQPTRKLGFKRQISNIFANKQSSYSPVALNWPQCDLKNQMPSTFQPNPPVNSLNESEKLSASENIYTTDVDIHVPPSIAGKDDDDDNQIQHYLDNQTIVTDDYYIDNEITTTTDPRVSLSLFDDFTNLFSRKNKHEIKFNKTNQRCSIM